MTPALSFVIPLYYSAETITPLVKEIEGLVIEGGHELVLVNDGSRDATAGICRELLRDARIPITFVNHARNFGEHNAVLTGYRHARGAYIVNLDDDGQNPPVEAARLWQQEQHQPCIGFVIANVTGGVEPYQYAWQPFGQKTNKINLLMATKYNVTVSDANGCRVTERVQ